MLAPTEMPLFLPVFKCWSKQVLLELVPITRLQPNSRVPLGPALSHLTLRPLLRFGLILQIWATQWLGFWFDHLWPPLLISMLHFYCSYATLGQWTTVSLSKHHVSGHMPQSFLFGHLAIFLGSICERKRRCPLHWNLQNYLGFLSSLCTPNWCQRGADSSPNHISGVYTASPHLVHSFNPLFHLLWVVLV